MHARIGTTVGSYTTLYTELVWGSLHKQMSLVVESISTGS